MARRVAVIIGIENTAGMRALPGAVQGAREMADWAQGEGWEVVYLTDEGDKADGRLDLLGSGSASGRGCGAAEHGADTMGHDRGRRRQAVGRGRCARETGPMGNA